MPITIVKIVKLVARELNMDRVGTLGEELSLRVGGLD